MSMESFTATSGAILEAMILTDVGESHRKCYTHRYAEWRVCCRMYASRAKLRCALTCILIAKKWEYSGTAAKRARREDFYLFWLAELIPFSGTGLAHSASLATNCQQPGQLSTRWATAPTSSLSRCLLSDSSTKTLVRGGILPYSILNSSV